MTTANETTKTTIDNMAEDGCVSALMQSYVSYNGQDIPVAYNRMSLTPGEFDEAREILPDNLYNALVTMWTPEVIEAYKASLVADRDAQ